jgi:hypothetical protein
VLQCLKQIFAGAKPVARVLPDGPAPRITLGRRRTPRRRVRGYEERPPFQETLNKGPDELGVRPQMFSGGSIEIARAEDTQYFDMLGPAVREALNWCFFRWCCLDILRAMRQRGLDPDNQIHDMKVAYEVERNDEQAKWAYATRGRLHPGETTCSCTSNESWTKGRSWTEGSIG